MELLSEKKLHLHMPSVQPVNWRRVCVSGFLSFVMLREQLLS